ncbi:DNA-binding transcriptional regulator, GntR family [Poseidonocella pacifica]|uniref:DNA-binding transcriptional regulator, GntR family n=1 Tax=Poseidonocella pacifica TaxID=871651 RepID=A0A1I0YL17_9RHOB|nr:GntR family transcriptional regulator [Poseidonocella pacifica]SFB12998.1 DNA-binding transcriptional regulator, GntR family [Poseidonocella pacifica]
MQMIAEMVKLDTSQPIGAQLYAILRGRIVQGELAPGTRLSEAGLAGDFQVSRQPIREVFIKLSEEGLLEIRPQRGTIVPRISVAMVEDARFVREAIEADVVRLAAEQFDARQKAELEDLLSEQHRTEDVRAFIELDDRFHRQLARGVGRAYAWHVIEGLKAQLDRVRYLSVAQFPRAKIIEQHAAIVEAIGRADPKGAESAMRLHLCMITEDLPEIVAGHADYFEDAPQGVPTSSGG